jgi:hypothetical protein
MIEKPMKMGDSKESVVIFNGSKTLETNSRAIAPGRRNGVLTSSLLTKES